MPEAENLTRGQAARNRYWAGRFARLRVLVAILSVCFVFGAWIGWQSMDDLAQQRASAYLSLWWEANSNPFAGNLGSSSDSVSRYLADESPLTLAMRAARLRMLICGLIAAIAIGLPLYRWRRQAWAEEGAKALEPVRVRGGELVESAELQALLASNVAADAVTIGGVAIPKGDEARHFLFAGATGTGKTTAIWQLLDQVERRGEHAFVHDVDGSYIARYYDEGRGDIVLNPFDVRCAHWNPFTDIRSAPDADRLACFIVPKSAPRDGGGEDIWVDQARIVAGAIIRRLWENEQAEVGALVAALRDFTPDQLRELTDGTEASRVFQKDAEKATASVLFCLAEAAKILGLLKPGKGSGAEISFDAFYDGLSERIGPKPWIFLSSRKRNFAAAKPLLGCWLDCAVASILDRNPVDPPRAWLVLDELPALPRASGLLTLLPEGRKFGAAVVIAFQAIGQLRETYGRNAAGTIVGQTASQLVMRLGDPESTQWATQLLGQAEVEDRRTSQTMVAEELTDQANLSNVRQTKAIVLDSEISGLAPLTGFLRLSGMPVARVAIARDHMDRPARAQASMPLPSPRPAVSRSPGWSDGGAL